MTPNQYLLIVYCAYLLIASLIALALFIKDKNMATKNAGPNRIKEKTLLGCAAIGGALGALIGRIVAHHKTQKIYFSIVIWVSLLLQLGVLGLIVYLNVR